MDACNNIIDKISSDSRFIRKRIVELSYMAGKNGSHTGGSLSSVEILSSLISLINWNGDDFSRDRIILSKGHAALALYCALERKGILTKEETDTFEINGSPFFAHAKRNISKGIEFSGGSLSMGISFAVGVSLACKERNAKNKIYVIVGDGECDEGLLWESLMAIANFKLDNITVIVDCNGIQSDGFTKEVMDTGVLAEKFKSFGFETYDIDGHNIGDILNAINVVYSKPKAIIAHTIKGKGVSFMENNPEWHHGVLTENLYNKAISELT